MRSFAILIAIACLATQAACTPPVSNQPPTTDAQGIEHYTASHVSQTIPCDGHPVILEGDHTQMTLTGACRLVTLAGSHNDITVDMAAGGTFVIAGGHNDVTWSQVQPGPPPSMQDKGDSNSWHPMKAHG